ncbi:radical SAM protein [Terrisporobacter sp.]
MHFTGTVYRNPYWPTEPLLEVTQGCTHNSCKFCTMYKGVPFRMSPIEWVEEDLKELSLIYPNTEHIQLVGGNPLCMKFEYLDNILNLIHKYLPKIKNIYTQGRVSDLKNKTVDELKILKEKGMKEISLGIESGDDWTLDRINKGYNASDILEQCHKLDEAGILYWMTFLNGVAGREHSHEHAVNSAKIFNQCKPYLVGTGGLTLFPGTPLLEEAKKGEFAPLTEKEMLIELRTFVENLEVDAYFITHHTIAMNLSGPSLQQNKELILQKLNHEINNIDEEKLSMYRRMKRTL